ncbi:hypothetical protein FC40_GL000708 [Ligilactobacillus hayakitensis DSM 18933 = JCM 14209]|uniref:Uncharacterized protein n=1 Tax=Ligilactobacillus hayakitensis DSM 18933 = JCM 14209 TaxID=1423755 RepID=A0A0R1WM28_9LACO|nr:bifunctional DNA primase/polymerase [Ligilactobacillus hayakitensis]KRM18919.1 hypothetical protein FC40_GL000708 [Ligilactobacillus hayakitensis DSM 18933 = JCM 14209]
MNILQEILKIANQGIYIFPLQSGSKKQFKNIDYTKATTDEDTIKSWFSCYPNMNVGINLKKSNLICFDIDEHKNTPLLSTLNDLKQRGYDLFKEPVRIETTQNNGIHVYFRLKQDKGQKLTNKINFIDNVDILTDKVVSYPSANYKLVKEVDFKSLPIAPTWMINHANNRTLALRAPHSTNELTKTGKWLEFIKKGALQGERNNFLTAVVGWLFYHLSDPYTVEYWSNLINDNCITPPLPQNEVNSIIKSIYRKEKMKRSKVNE